MPNPAPKTFNGYTITREAFVRGGSGVVHDAVDSQGRRVAIKVLDRTALEKKLSAAISEGTPDPAEVTEKTSIAYEKNVERFKEEYRNLTGLNHPNVAKVYEMGFREGSFFIVYEYVDGKPIAEYVRLWKAADMIPIFVNALQGLDYIHRNGLLHLDIKSENILVQETSGKPKVKIIDFGLSMAPTEYEGGFLGSVNYMAPEIVLGLKDQVNARADLFSFGVLMYFCITWVSHPYARPPKASRELMCRVVKREPTFKHDPPSYAHLSRPGYVPEFLDKIVMRLVAHDPEDRFYTNARAVINALITHAPDAFFESPETKGSYLRPIGDRHIGNETEQSKVYTAIDALASGETPSPAIVEITGRQGIGKSHLLKKIKEHAERYADKLTIKKIELPADDVALKRFSDDITLWASENKMPAVVLVDNCHRDPAGGGSGDPASPIIQNLLNSITQRQQNPALYSGQQPMLIAFTSSFSTPSPLVTADGGIAPKALMGEGWGEGKHYLTISLSPFTPADLKTYLSSTPAFAGKKAPDELVSRLHEVTEGIQSEVAAHLCERDSDGMLFNLDGEIVVGNFKRHEKAPATTEARLQKTYDGLLPEERRLLDFLSVWSLKQITPPPDFETISHLISSPLIALHLNNLSAVIARSVPIVIARSPKGDEAIQSNSTYSFTNPYFSTLIYNQLDEKTKTRLHDSIAVHLRTHAFTHLNTHALKDSLLLHQGLGSNKSLALKSLVKLARKNLYEQWHAGLSTWLIEYALTSAESVKLKIYLKGFLAAVKFYEGKYKEVEEITKRVISKTCEAADYAPWLNLTLHIWRIFNLIQLKKHNEAMKEIETLLIMHEKKKNNVFYPVLMNLKALNLYQWSFADSDKSASLLEKSRETYYTNKLLEMKLPRQSAARINSNCLGIALKALGKLREATAELEESLAKKEHTVFSKITFLIALAETYRLLKENQKAEGIAKEVLRVSSASGLGEWMMYAHETLANIYHDTDRFDEALKEDIRYLAASGCIEGGQAHRQTSMRLWIHMGHCYKEKGNFDAAALHFNSAIATGAGGFYLMSANEGLGEIYCRRGLYDKALSYFKTAEELLANLPQNASAESHSARICKLKEEIKRLSVLPASPHQ